MKKECWGQSGGFEIRKSSPVIIYEPQLSSVKWGQSYSPCRVTGRLYQDYGSPLLCVANTFAQCWFLSPALERIAGNPMLEINSSHKTIRQDEGYCIQHFSPVFYLPGSPESYLSSLMGRKRWYFPLSYIVMAWPWATSLICASVSLCIMGSMQWSSFVILWLGNYCPDSHWKEKGLQAPGECLLFDGWGESVFSARSLCIWATWICYLSPQWGPRGSTLTCRFWRGSQTLPSARRVLFTPRALIVILHLSHHVMAEVLILNGSKVLN